MNNDTRIAFYVRDLERKTADGFYRLTPRQRRRAQHKYNRARGAEKRAADELAGLSEELGLYDSG